MKIGDEVYVHGYVDEIRKDNIIIRNDGGYFGTVSSEVAEQEPSEDCISREWVLNKIHAYAEADTTSTEKSIGANCCAEFVECAPSAVPTTEKSSMVDRSIIKYWRRYLEEMKKESGKMNEIIIRFKSGREFRFKCEEYTIKTFKLDGTLSEFTYKGGVGECPIYFQEQDIECIAIIGKEQNNDEARRN